MVTDRGVGSAGKIEKNDKRKGLRKRGRLVIGTGAKGVIDGQVVFCEEDRNAFLKSFDNRCVIRRREQEEKKKKMLKKEKNQKRFKKRRELEKLFPIVDEIGKLNCKDEIEVIEG